MDPALKTSCPGLHKTFGNILHNIKGNKWKYAVSETAAKAEDILLKTLEDVRSFVQNARRVHRQHRGLNGSYFIQRSLGRA